MNFRCLKTSFILCLLVVGLHAQTKSVGKPQKYYQHEVKVSYGILNFPNGMVREDDIWKGSYTATYMYRPKKWVGIGANVNWQYPSEMQYYRYREYYPDGSSEDFVNAAQNRFFAIAPEIRFSYINKNYLTNYFAFSYGYAVYTGLKKGIDNEIYWGWHVTLYGFNVHFGKEKKFFAGGEVGLGYKGVYNLHAGYRF